MTPPAETPQVRIGKDGRAWSLAFLALLALACVAVYLPALHGAFLFDDIRNILENPNVRMERLDADSLRRAVVPHWPLNLRPLSFLSFALNHLFGGYDPFGYHAVNIAILLLSIPPAYLLALRLAGAWFPHREAWAAALGTTAVWALHPLLTGGVSSIVQRMTSLYTLFSLAALLFFLRGRTSGRPAPYALAAVSLLLALASKETALFTPLLALLALWLLPREAGGSGPRAGWTLLGVVAATQAVTFFAAGYAQRAQWIPPQPFDAAERLLTEGRVVARYLSLYLLPLPSRLTLDYDFPVSTSLLAPPSTLPAAALHAALIALAIRARRRRPLLAFGVLGFYLLQLPEGTFMPLDLIFEHRAYFPAFFLSLALMDLLLLAAGRLRAPRPALAALGVAVALAAAGGGLAYQRNQFWADPLTMWKDTVAKSPGSVRVRYNYSLALRDLGRGAEALEQAQIAVAMKPNSPDAIHNLGVVHMSLGQPELALGFLQRAVLLNPDQPVPLNNLASDLGMLGRHEEALAFARRAVAVRPDYAKAHFNLAIALHSLGRRAEAIDTWRTLQGIDPELAEKLGGLLSRPAP